MPPPSASWSVRRVYGTYRNVLSLNMEPGTWSASITGRIVNTLADGTKQIFRPGVIGTGALNTIEGQPSIDLQLPVTDDPDNTPSGGAVTLTITFAAGGSETYTISPLESWPVGTTGGSGGTDLATLLDPAITPSAPPLVTVGVAGGVARLDADGDVVDADGVKVTGGGAGLPIAISDVTNLTTELAARALFANSVKFVYKDTTTGFWPSGYNSSGDPIYTGGSASAAVRPSSSDRCMVFWVGAAPKPDWVASGTGGAHTPDVWIRKPA